MREFGIAQAAFRVCKQIYTRDMQYFLQQTLHLNPRGAGLKRERRGKSGSIA
jgi:hypothetical protein